ncbi:MAG: hypothetical protein ABIE94_04130 [archaeon]
MEAVQKKPEKISTKRMSYQLLEARAFGNKLRTWDSIEDMENSDYKGTVTMRHKNVYGGGFIEYRVPVFKISKMVDEWVRRGARKEDITFNESAPDDTLLIQGEVARSWVGYHLRFSTEKKPMRDALKDCKHARGLQVKMLLQKHLTPSSYEDIQALLEMFPEHVVEFSAYNHCLGDIPGRNAVIWEVRLY